MVEFVAQLAISALVNAGINAIFPTRIEGPRLSNLRAQKSTYGAPIPRVWGPEPPRCAGNVIYSSGLIERKKKESSKGKGKQQVTTYTYSTNVAVLLSDGRSNGFKRIWANGKLIFDRDTYAGPVDGPTTDYGMRAQNGSTNGQVWSRIWYYEGTAVQTPNSYLESALGVGNTPAYRHSTYVVIEGLQLADFGNSLPQLEFEIVGQESASLGDVVDEIVQACGAPGVVGKAGTPQVRGYMLASESKAWDALKPLLAAYAYDIADHGGQLRLQKRGQGMAGVLEREMLGVQAHPRKAGDVVVLERIEDRELPLECTVTFADANRDYQPNAVQSRRQIGSSESKTTADLPLTLTTDEAASIADRILFEQHTTRRTVKFNGSRSHAWLLPGKAYGVPTPTRDVLPFRILRKTEGNDGVIEFEGAYEDGEIYTSERPGADSDVPTNTVPEAGPTTLLLIDAPMLAPEDDDTGFYWGATGSEDGWRGGVIFRSSDGGASFTQMALTGSPAILGEVASALGDGPVDLWDYANTLTVQLVNADDELESVSAAAVLNGANCFWLGGADGQDGEIIQFQTATLTAPGVYELSGLLRGRRGTDHATATHGPNEIFMLIEPDTLERENFGAGDWNKERQYKPVTLLTDIDDVTGQNFTNTGERKRPFSPVHIHGERDGSNNLALTAVRRTRISAPDLGEGPVPLGEETEAYEVDILDGVDVVRTISISGAPAATYTAAEQTADGLTPGDPVSLVWYQLSTVRGRGRGRAATV